MSAPPKLSVITVVYNDCSSIEKTIKSVLRQPYANLEYVVIDGGSTDGTLDIIERYEKDVDCLVSEPDGGIYDAMNKGIRKATGKGLLFMNSGDYIEGEILTGNLKIPSFLPVKYSNFFGREVFDSITDYRQGLPVCHQGIIFENKGLAYNDSYKIAADYDYFLRHGYTDGLPVLNTDGFICYDNNGFSIQNYDERDREVAQIIHNYFGIYWATIFKIKSQVKRFIRGVWNAN